MARDPPAELMTPKVAALDIQQWQFSIQRELPSQILVEAAYLGMLSLK